MDWNHIVSFHLRVYSDEDILGLKKMIKIGVKVIPGIHRGRLSILINKYHYLGNMFI